MAVGPGTAVQAQRPPVTRRARGQRRAGSCPGNALSGQKAKISPFVSAIQARGPVRLSGHIFKIFFINLLRGVYCLVKRHLQSSVLCH